LLGINRTLLFAYRIADLSLVNPACPDLPEPLRLTRYLGEYHYPGRRVRVPIAALLVLNIQNQFHLLPAYN